MITALAEEVRVADLMTLDPVVIRNDEPVDRAKELLERYRITGLPVVDDAGALVGVISQTDLVHASLPHISDVIRHKSRELRVGELMSVPPITISMSASIKSAAQVMTWERVHRLVATNEDGQPIGVLSASDIVALIAEGQPPPA
jgi:CBS domain-containing protein